MPATLKVTEPACTVSRSSPTFHSDSVTFTACADASDAETANAAAMRSPSVCANRYQAGSRNNSRVD